MQNLFTLCVAFLRVLGSSMVLLKVLCMVYTLRCLNQKGIHVKCKTCNDQGSFFDPSSGQEICCNCDAGLTPAEQETFAGKVISQVFFSSKVGVSSLCPGGKEGSSCSFNPEQGRCEACPSLKTTVIFRTRKIGGWRPEVCFAPPSGRRLLLSYRRFYGSMFTAVALCCIHVLYVVNPI